MKISIFSCKDYEKKLFTELNQHHELNFISQKLDLTTADDIQGAQAVCCFVIDKLNKEIIKKLSLLGIKLIALRSAGFDHVDLSAARKLNIKVVRVPRYSPQAVAEFAVALILTLGRKIIPAYTRGLAGKFSLEKQIGFNLFQKTIGIIGTGNIGSAFARILHGFGCQLLAYDPVVNEDCHKLGVNYVTLNELLSQADIISLHCPLNKDTHYILNADTLSTMKKGAMLINTGRGALIDTAALILALEAGQVGYAGLDVYENEQGLFFEDHAEPIQDKLFLKLQSFPQVLITPHQAFLTIEAVTNIIRVTLENISAYEQGKIINEV